MRHFLVLILAVLAGCLIWAAGQDAVGLRVEGKADQRRAIGPEVRKAVAAAESAPVAALKPDIPKTLQGKPGSATARDIPGNPPAKYPAEIVHDQDGSPARQSGVPMPPPIVSFDGLSNYDNIDAYGLVIIPPDMTGDVGPDHYVQAVNALVRIFDKSGNAAHAAVQDEQPVRPAWDRLLYP